MIYYCFNQILHSIVLPVKGIIIRYKNKVFLWLLFLFIYDKVDSCNDPADTGEHQGRTAFCLLDPCGNARHSVFKGAHVALKQGGTAAEIRPCT